MALKKRSVAKLNNIVFKYLEQLGMTDEAKREFVNKANAMIGVESFKSVWFQRMTTQLYQVLQETEKRVLEIDLNVPVISDSKNTVYHQVVAAVEDEGRSDTDRKRKRVESQHGSGIELPSTALRLHESQALASGSGMPKPYNIRPFDKHKDKVTLILVSDSD